MINVWCWNQCQLVLSADSTNHIWQKDSCGLSRQHCHMLESLKIRPVGPKANYFCICFSSLGSYVMKINVYYKTICIYVYRIIEIYMQYPKWERFIDSILIGYSHESWRCIWKCVSSVTRSGTTLQNTVFWKVSAGAAH